MELDHDEVPRKRRAPNFYAHPAIQYSHLCSFQLKSHMFVGSSCFIPQELLLDPPSHAFETPLDSRPSPGFSGFPITSWASKFVAHSWDHHFAHSIFGRGQPSHTSPPCLGSPRPSEVCARSSWPWISCCKRCMRRCCPRAQRKFERGRSVPGNANAGGWGAGREIQKHHGKIMIIQFCWATREMMSVLFTETP